MIMNVLNGIWSDIYIMQTIIQKEKKKGILSPLAFLVVKTKRNIQSTYQKNVQKHVDYY